MSKKHLALYGLKFNPFSREIPTEGCLVTPSIERFCRRVQMLTQEGGFALIVGESGSGKSVALRLLTSRLTELRDVEVREVTRPQCSVADFYRELGDLYGVALTPHNRFRGAKVLREQWLAHLDTTLRRTVLLIDEAQEMNATVLNELRLLSAAKLDSRCLLTVVLAGDSRLTDRLGDYPLIALGTRIRVRLTLEPVSPAELNEYLRQVLTEAGNAQLMTTELKKTLVEHAAGSPRILMNMAHDLLEEGAQREAPQLDDQLFLDVFAAKPAQGRSAQGRKRKRA